MKHRKLRFKSLFLLIFISYVVVLLIPPMMIIVVHFHSESIIRSQIVNSNFALLHQMQNTVDDHLDEID